MIYEAELFRDELESTRCFWLTTIGMYNTPEQKSCGFQCGTCVKVFVGFGFMVLYVKWDTVQNIFWNYYLLLQSFRLYVGMMISKFVTRNII